MFAPKLDSQSIKIGELLVLSGALDSGDVVEAVTVSRRLAMPIGRVLIASGCISEELLEASLQAQVLVWEGSISVDLAEAALKWVLCNKLGLHEALGELHWDANFGTDTASFVDLLLESEIVSRDQLELAIRIDTPDVTPLTSALVVQGLLSPKFFPMIGQIQQKLRSNAISRADAANELRAAYRVWLKAESSLEQHVEVRETYRDRVFRPFVPQPFLVNTPPSGGETFGVDAVHNQANAPGDAMSVRNQDNSSVAASTSVPISVEDREIAAVIPELIPAADHKLRLVDLLVASERLELIQVQRAFEQIMEDSQLSSEILMALGLVDQATCNVALQYHDLLSKGLMSEDEAVTALRQRPADACTEQQAAASRRRSGLKRALTAAVVGGIAAVAMFSRKR